MVRTAVVRSSGGASQSAEGKLIAAPDIAPSQRRWRRLSARSPRSPTGTRRRSSLPRRRRRRQRTPPSRSQREGPVQPLGRSRILRLRVPQSPIPSDVRQGDRGRASLRSGPRSADRHPTRPEMIAADSDGAPSFLRTREEPAHSKCCTRIRAFLHSNCTRYASPRADCLAPPRTRVHLPAKQRRAPCTPCTLPSVVVVPERRSTTVGVRGGNTRSRKRSHSRLAGSMDSAATRTLH